MAFYLGSGFNNVVHDFTVDTNGRFIVGGNFILYKGVSVEKLVVLNPNGDLAISFTGFGTNDVLAVEVDDSNNIYAGGQNGDFKSFKSDGTTNTDFNIGTGFDDVVRDIRFYNNKIYVVGDFTTYSGSTVNGIVRLNLDGTIDSTFTTGTGFNGDVTNIEFDSDDKIYFGGRFTSYDGNPSTYLCRLLSGGTFDSSFTSYASNPGVNSYFLKPQIDNKILVGGTGAMTYSGVTTGSFYRLNDDGTLDTGFPYNQLSINATIEDIEVDDDGKIYLGGLYQSYSGVTLGGISRLYSGGTIDYSFDTGIGLSDIAGDPYEGYPNKIELIDSKVVLAGFFGFYKTYQMNYFLLTDLTGGTETFSTSITAPYNVQYIPGTNTITIFWTRGDDYDRQFITIDGEEIEISPTATNYVMTGVTPTLIYLVYVTGTIDASYGHSETIEATIEGQYPKPFCSVDNQYTYSGATCGNSDGIIEIYTKLYVLYYNMVVKDLEGNSYYFNTNQESPLFGVLTGLTSGWYIIYADVKPLYKDYLQNDGCVTDYIPIENTDSSVSLYDFKSKPHQCGPFDIQDGRFTWSVSGTSSTYSAYIWKTSDTPGTPYWQNINFASGDIINLNGVNDGCYIGYVISDDDNCKHLIGETCVDVVGISSIGGIKRLFITPYSSDLEYDYWKSSDESYYVESEDTSFFLSTKIKRYYSASGGTLNWYSIPVKGDMSLSQNLAKTRQGFILTDTLNVSVPKGTIERFGQFTTLLGNKWVYIVEDGNGYWWTGGFAVGATVETYKQQIGERGGENKYTFQFQAISSDKLLTSIDKTWVDENILN